MGFGLMGYATKLNTLPVDAPGWEYQSVPLEADPGHTNLAVPETGWETGAVGPFTHDNAWPLRTEFWARRTVTVAGIRQVFTVAADNGCVVFANGEVIGSSNRNNVVVANNAQYPVTFAVQAGGTYDLAVKAFTEASAGDDAGNYCALSIASAEAYLVWPCPPEWSNPVVETLAWLTDAMQAKTGGSQARSLRAAPRRSFSFSGVADGAARRIVDAIRFDGGVQQLVLPIYTDVQWLDAALGAGAINIPCRTTGFEFTVGGCAVLWLDATHWEVVAIDSIATDALVLAAATTSSWPLGTRLYPLRTARLGSASRASHHSEDVSSIDAAILVDEPCDWPAAWPTSTTYRGLPVLEWRNEESEDPTDQYDRLGDSVDQDTGPVFYFDLPGMPFRVQTQRFVIAGRDQHAAFRSLLYALNGRASQIWVPSWQADMQLAQPVTSSAEQLTVPWAGYTRFGRMQVNRRDLAIELFDGTLLYRRVIGSAESGDNETLQIDSALGVAVDPSQVRQIGWLSVCSQATDTVTIQHATDADGVAIATLTWQAVKSDV